MKKSLKNKLACLITAGGAAIVLASCGEVPDVEGGELIKKAREAYSSLESARVIMTNTETGEQEQEFVFKYDEKGILTYSYKGKSDKTSYAQYNNGLESFTDENGKVTAVTVSNTLTDGTDFTGSGSETFSGYVVRVLGINKYSGGMAYYNIRIRHFDDDETPWSGTGRNVNDVDHIYGYESGGSWSLTEQSTKNFLGRYGVVRNNWYQIEVDGVRSIGEPVPPTPGDTPDDEIENYISLKIHVLPWAIRKQHHTL